jgi:hypothetical protein
MGGLIKNGSRMEDEISVRVATFRALGHWVGPRQDLDIPINAAGVWAILILSVPFVT